MNQNAPSQTFKLSKGATDALSGSLGGIASILIGHPLDTVKVRLQSETLSQSRFTAPRTRPSSLVIVSIL